MLDLSLFDTLLYRDQRTMSQWVSCQDSNQHIPLKFQAIFEITYDELSNETEWVIYRQIENTSHCFLNDLEVLIQNSEATIYPYIFYAKTITPLEKVMQNYHLVMSSQRTAPITEEILHENEYENVVLDIAKHFLVWIYAEVKEKMSELLDEKGMHLFQIYERFFQTDEPHPPVICDRILNLPPQPKQIINQDSPETPPQSTLTFEQLIRSPEQFHKVEEQMIGNQLMDQSKCFLPAHGNRTYLAAVYIQLIQKNYFHSRIFPQNRNISPIDVRRFLDQRYQVNLQKQFSYWLKYKKEHTSFVEKYYWLDNL